MVEYRCCIFPVVTMNLSLFLYVSCLVIISYFHYRYFNERGASSFSMSDSFDKNALEEEEKVELEHFHEIEEMTPLPTSIASIQRVDIETKKEVTTPSPEGKVWIWPSKETQVLPDFGMMETNRRNARMTVTRRV